MSSKSRKTPRKNRDIFDGKRDATTQLYRAVKRYVESKGGSILVIGGISVQEWPDDRQHMYHIAVKCLGRKPAFEKQPVSEKASHE